jgi:hypothetical protein
VINFISGVIFQSSSVVYRRCHFRDTDINEDDRLLVRYQLTLVC